MPKPRKEKLAPYKWLGHIPVYFNDKDVAECMKWIGDRDINPTTGLDTLVQKETSVKISYSNMNDSYYISLQPKRRDSMYWGYTLGFNHVDLLRLLQIALYVHEVLVETAAIELPNGEGVPDW